MKDTAARKVIIGITGIYCSGKSTVADMLSEKGAFKIDADRVGHEVLRDEKVKNRIIDIWGEEVLRDGEIERRALAEKVFGSRQELDKLCVITHPEIIRRIKDSVLKSGVPVVALDAPLLIETGTHKMVDKVVVVRSSVETCIKRAVFRGVSRETAMKVINMQISAEKKEEMADFIIDNDGDIEQTKQGVERLWQEI